MKTFQYPLYVVLLAIGSLFIQCAKDDDTPELINQEEEINRVTFDVTADNNTTTYTWEEGASNFSLPLKANKTYEVAVSFFNATDVSAVEPINPEVIEEADEHQVFYENSSSFIAIASVSTDNKDSSGNPLGLKTAWTTSATGEALVRLYLIHEPTTKSGASRADFEGETDVQIDINVAVTE